MSAVALHWRCNGGSTGRRRRTGTTDNDLVRHFDEQYECYAKWCKRIQVLLSERTSTIDTPVADAEVKAALTKIAGGCAFSPATENFLTLARLFLVVSISLSAIVGLFLSSCGVKVVVVVDADVIVSA